MVSVLKEALHTARGTAAMQHGGRFRAQNWNRSSLMSRRRRARPKEPLAGPICVATAAFPPLAWARGRLERAGGGFGRAFDRSIAMHISVAETTPRAKRGEKEGNC